MHPTHAVEGAGCVRCGVVSAEAAAGLRCLYARRMAKKRGYSDEFPTTREKRVTFTLDKIPPALWIRVRAKAKREGVALRPLILGWCQEWVEKDRKP